MTPAIAAHRGGADLWPENSMTAFEGAKTLDVEYVEFDVHATRDGELVVHHDATLDRMTDAQGAIMDLTAAEVREAVIVGTADDRSPTLDETIDCFKPSKIDLRVEIKLNAKAEHYPGVEAATARALAAKNMLGRSVVSAFSIDALDRFRAVATPGRGFLWLINPLTLRHIGGVRGAIRIAQEFEIGEICPRAPDMTRELVAAARDAGLRIGAYAVNDRETIARMLDLGIDAFTSDRPDIAVDLRAERARV